MEVFMNAPVRILSVSLALSGLLASGCQKAPAPVERGGSSPATKPSPKPPVSRGDADDEEEDGIIERRDPSVGYVPAPRAEELVFSDVQQRRLLEAARAGCDGKTPPAAGDLAGTKTGVIVVRYDEDGRRAAKKRVDGAADVVTAAFEAGRGACDGSRKGFLHLLAITRQIHVLNFGIKGIFDNKVFEPQVTGLIYNLDGRRFELDPLEMLERNMGAGDTRNAMAKGIGIDANQVPNRIDLTMELYRTAHVGERFPDKQPAFYFRGHERLQAADVTQALLHERLKLIGQWYKNNVIDGEVTYMYVTSRGVYANHERTMIRSTIATMVLNRLANTLDDDVLRKKGAEVIDFYLERYFQMEKSKAAGKLIPSTQPIASGNRVEGRWTAAGFIAAACLERTDSDRYADEMRLLMDWGLGHQRKDGVFWTPSGGEQYFMPGQFLLPVSYFYRKTKDKKYKEAFDRAFAVYDPALRDTMAFGPEWHVPYAPAWFTMPLAQMYAETKDARYKDLIFAINDRVVLAADINSRYQVYPDYDGMLAPKPLSYGNNSVTAAALESLTDAAIVARMAGDMERFKRYQAVIKRTTAFLLRLQYTPTNTYYLQHRDRVVGGFKYDMVNTKLWMDNVWHLTSAFIKIHEEKLLDD
jgi:hypothetical protein